MTGENAVGAEDVVIEVREAEINNQRVFWDHYHQINNDNYLFADLEGQWNGPFCFVQAADTQFGMIESYLEKKENPGWDKEVALTRKAIRAANEMQPRPKFFVVCGDLLDAFPDEKPDMREEQEHDFKTVFSQLSSEIPLVCVCGNHDIGNTPSRQTVSAYRSSFGDDFFSFWVGGVFFIVLNSQYYWDSSE
uniref:Calcineurin-like phosphoesterase domain-containing protein n=1 Tax=Strigamia maritima TaxID=126957 RepID=T1IS27_STRMM